MKSKLNKEIAEYFKEPEIPPINEATVERLKQKTLNRESGSKRVMLKRFAFSAACVLLVCMVALLPILLQKPTYYSDVETNEQPLTIQYAQTYISENYSKYSFIFDEFTVGNIDGIYSNDKNELLGIRLIAEKNDIPFSTLKFCLVINKNFTPCEKEKYIVNTEKQEKDGYILYFKEKLVGTDDLNLYGIMEYKNYCLYVLINYEDYDAFNKFL